MLTRHVDRLTSLLIIVGGVLIIVGLFFYISPFLTSNTRNENHNVPALQYLTLTWALDKAEKIEGYFTVRGGGDDVDFHIKDPYGSVILDAGRVTGRRDFAFTAEYSGAYTLYFDNSFSIFTSKTIFLSYQQTLRIFPGDLSLLITILGVLILVLGVIRLYQKQIKERGKAAPPPPPPIDR